MNFETTVLAQTLNVFSLSNSRTTAYHPEELGLINLTVWVAFHTSSRMEKLHLKRGQMYDKREANIAPSSLQCQHKNEGAIEVFC